MVEILPIQTIEEIKRLLQKKQERSELLEPQPGDEDNYIGDTQVIAASAITTVTWTLKRDYIYFFKRLYIDAAYNITHSWKLTRVASLYETEKTIDGNDHEFDLPLKVHGGTTLTLTVTNLGVANTLDIVIRSWARRKVV